MKLSEVKGDRVIDILVEIIPLLTKIAGDEKVLDTFKKAARSKKTDVIKTVSELVPVLLGKHKDDIIGVLAAINGVPAEQYAADMTLQTFMRDIMDIMTDEELLGFLNSSQTVVSAKRGSQSASTKGRSVSTSQSGTRAASTSKE